jgi:hypothetical protein
MIPARQEDEKGQRRSSAANTTAEEAKTVFPFNWHGQFFNRHAQ